MRLRFYFLRCLSALAAIWMVTYLYELVVAVVWLMNNAQLAGEVSVENVVGQVIGDLVFIVLAAVLAKWLFNWSNELRLDLIDQVKQKMIPGVEKDQKSTKEADNKKRKTLDEYLGINGLLVIAIAGTILGSALRPIGSVAGVSAIYYLVAKRKTLSASQKWVGWILVIVWVIILGTISGSWQQE